MRERSSSSYLTVVTAWLLTILMAIIVFWAFLTSFYGWKIYLEVFSHFQLQYFMMALILLGILSFLRFKPTIFIGLFFCGILALQILPWYLPPYKFIPQESADLRVLVANIRTRNRNYDLVLDLVKTKQPDIAIFIEVDNAWRQQLDELKNLLPYSSGDTDFRNLGILVYSNRAFQDLKTVSFGTERRASAIAQLQVKDRSVTLLATHPVTPIRPDLFHARNRQLDLITQYLATVDRPVILVGDLNMTMWSPYHRRLVNKTGLKNSRKGFGILPTWPTQETFTGIQSKLSSLFTIPIDHCLVSDEFKTTNIDTGSRTGSDHKPLIVDLRLTSI